MASRTPEGKHTKRFIIEYYSEVNQKWVRSHNEGHPKPFATREVAQAAFTPESTDDGFNYRIRMK